MNTSDDLTLDFQDAHLHSRRDFLKRLGGGIAIFVTFGGKLALVEQAEAQGSRGVPTDFNAFLRIAENGRVTCLSTLR